MRTIVLDFLSPADRAKHTSQYLNGGIIDCNSANDLLYQLSLINSNDTPVIIQILAHGYTNGTGLSNNNGESISWQNLASALSTVRTNYAVRLNLLQPCFSHTIRVYLQNLNIDFVWVNTSGFNGEFSAAFISNEYSSFEDFKYEEVDGQLETTYEKFKPPY